ncbi:MAG TPA: transcription antitermination factor NusB [Candidatus Avamphibacillus intestinigallinarum]|nr:transcription antitermination factor NusB [Candidatus Avamphibacillus intestinigallinarum]
MNRHESRERAFQVLYQLDWNTVESRDVIEHSFGEMDQNDFFDTLVFGVRDKKDELDALIAEHLENWSIDRIATTEKTILRIAVFEMKYLEDIPVNVSINEAVELANVFGDEKSGRFVNGVLSKITF